MNMTAMRSQAPKRMTSMSGIAMTIQEPKEMW